MIRRPRKPPTDGRKAESARIKAEIRKHADARAARKAEAERVRADAVQCLSTWIIAHAERDELPVLARWLGSLRPEDVDLLLTALDRTYFV
jgi:hypothetical protein